MPSALPLHPIARLPEDWAEHLRQRGERPYRAQQVFRWIHHRAVLDPAQMTDIAVSLRTALTEEGIGRVLTVVDVRRAADRTRKLLLGLKDGANIESVLIPSHLDLMRAGALEGAVGDAAGATLEGDVEPDADSAAADDEEGTEGGVDGAPAGRIRVTQCISTQVGCAMGCVFCASGVAGLKRHLAAEEIVAQVLEGKAQLEPGEELRNVVLMGMGEPLHNYEATARALKLLIHPMGANLSPRRVTVSTSGLVPEIARLGRDFSGQISLAVSLHAADDETRSRLMPINRKYPIAQLVEALRAYPMPKRRRITIEYTLVQGRNDDLHEAKKVAQLLRGIPVKVNLIPMNPIAASSLGPPSLEGALAFQKVLLDAGYSCFIRRRRGDDVAAACGQLALLGAKPKVRVDRS